MSDDEATARRRFAQISPRAYEHPVDRGALTALRSVPGFAQVLKAVFGFYSERGLRLSALASAIRVGEAQYPQLDAIRHECAEILDLEVVPEVYVTLDPTPRASTIGMDRPFIVLSTGLVDLLEPAGHRFAIGHEMGHIHSGHALYRTMLLIVTNLTTSWSWNPVSAVGLRAVSAALAEWYRKSELSCDRAGLLCTQDPAAALRVGVQMAGGIDPDQVDIPSFLRQAEEYDAGGDIRDSLHKLLSVEQQSHPVAVVRAAELQKWAASTEYRDILAGQYPRRDGAEQSSITEDIAAAGRSYRESVSESADPLSKVFSDVGAAVSGVADKVFSGRRRQQHDD